MKEFYRHDNIVDSYEGDVYSTLKGNYGHIMLQIIPKHKHSIRRTRTKNFSLIT
jgi:hypothetical protein